jgi:DNA-directed RNA polymerase subunit RPC12/RpoP
MRCKNCGHFLDLSGKCNNPKCKKRVINRYLLFGEELYRCGDCGKYLPKDYFGFDKSKKFNIRYNCKECRSKNGNGNH